MFFHTTVIPGSGTGIPVLRSSSTVNPVPKKSAGIANLKWDSKYENGFFVKTSFELILDY
jgi:hypothetical protein